MLTNKALLEEIASEGKHTFVSTGMSTLEQIGKAVQVFKSMNCSYELMHCNISYPMKVEDANLKTIKTLKDTFDCNIGYSGHETGIIVSCAAVCLGATSVERHITLDRAMYGSDQSASLEIPGLIKLVKYIRSIEAAMGTGEKIVTETESNISEKLRRVDTL